MEQGVPHLRLANQRILFNLEKEIIEQQPQIEGWFREKWQAYPRPLMCSVDLRNAGFKLAPVDSNLFPSGFNNLNPEFYPLGILAMQNGINQKFPNCRKILLVPEQHNRNQYYLESLSVLCEFVIKAGYELKIGALEVGHDSPKFINLPSGRSIGFFHIIREADCVGVKDFQPDVIVLNNDLSLEIPEVLMGIQQPIVPNLQLGWSQRRKSNHFRQYQTIAHEFCTLFQVDPWTIAPYFDHCRHVDFMAGVGLEDLVTSAQRLFEKIQAKYDHHNIKQPPFLVIKSDSGTYGQAVMMIQSPEEIEHLNRKRRTQMAKGKGGKEVSDVLLQEGIPTSECLGDQKWPAEPIVYMIGGSVIGGFYRVHRGKNATQNLNAPGMHFEPLSYAECCHDPQLRFIPHDTHNHFYAYSVVSRLALLACAMESVPLEEN